MAKHFVEHFAGARTSWSFVVGLGLLIAGWTTGHFLIPWFDPDLTVGNYFLSVEASMSMPVLYMAIEIAAARDRAKLDELLGATRELIARLSAVAEDVEEIQEELEDDE